MSKQGHADHPGTRARFWVLDRSFIKDVVRACHRVAFNHGHGGAVVIASSIKPCLVIESTSFGYEGLPFPVSDGLTHPRINLGRSGVLHIDVT